MKTFKTIILLGGLLLTSSMFAQSKVIYGYTNVKDNNLISTKERRVFELEDCFEQKISEGDARLYMEYVRTDLKEAKRGGLDLRYGHYRLLKVNTTVKYYKRTLSTTENDYYIGTINNSTYTAKVYNPRTNVNYVPLDAEPVEDGLYEIRYYVGSSQIHTERLIIKDGENIIVN